MESKKLFTALRIGFIFLESMPVVVARAEGGWAGAAVALFMLVIGALILASLVIWIWMLVDCIRRDFNEKALWLLIILLTGIIGAIVYYFVVKRPADSEYAAPPVPHKAAKKKSAKKRKK